MQTVLEYTPPSTRYVGSKRKISNWIIENIQNLDFRTFLDGFGGTGTIGYQVKRLGKRVTYNDNLKFNYYIGKSIIENNSIQLSEKDLEFILQKHDWISYPKFIQKTFNEIYYTAEENKWLDFVITNIRYLNNDFKKSIAFNALFQACIRKRPYNLFHRNNLYMRFARVKRNFYNKTTWDVPFESHFRNFVDEINLSVFDNGLKNKATNSDIYDLSDNFDVVYIDTPYMSPKSWPINYRNYYHFLEGIVCYRNWGKMINYELLNKGLVTIKDDWVERNRIGQAFDILFHKFKDSTLIVSYRSGGIPSEYQIRKLLLKHKEKVITKKKEYQYVLSKKPIKELLFIAS